MYKAIAAKKQAERDALIPQEWKIKSFPPSDQLSVIDFPKTCNILTPRELSITEDFDATALALEIASKKFTSVEVTIAFCKRAAIAQQLTNCLTEIMFDQALQRAKYLDHHLNHYGKPVGPLHGLPISLKDSFKLSGIDSSIGFAALVDKPSLTTSPLVLDLLSAGAIFHCKTNIPQMISAFDSVNNIFGRTINPLNSKVTAGGSSGGEGVLVAMKGSAFGIGTDIAGSIRVPAFVNGVYGFMPSAYRIPYAGQEGGELPGASSYRAYGLQARAGPIARSVRDCGLMLKAIADTKPWERDPAIIPGFWNSQDLSLSATIGAPKPLTIGILRSDGLTTPLPPIQKVLGEVAASLRKAGVSIIELPIPSDLKNAQSITNDLLGLDGGHEMLDLLESYEEPLIPWLKPFVRRRTPKSLEFTRNANGRREALMTELLSIWKPNGIEIDALICPVAPHPVPLIDAWVGHNYTSAWVLLDCPAGTVFVRNIQQGDLDEEIVDTEPTSMWDMVNRGHWNTRKIDRKVYLNTPLSVQVVAPRLQEKRLYRAMEVVNNAIRQQQPQARGPKL